MTETTHPTTIARACRSMGLLSTALLSALASCGDSGGRAFTPVGGSPKTGPIRELDFGLRRDFHLSKSFLGDVLHEDLNGDGIEDLVESNFLAMQITVALGQPDGTFATLLELQTLGHAWRLTTGDFDGDGAVDLAVLSQEYRGTGAPGVQVFLQRGAGGFSAADRATLAIAADPTDLTAAPMTGTNGDLGPDELFVAIPGARQVARMSLNAANLGQLDQTGALDSASLGALGRPFSVAIVDVGGNGRLDLVVGEIEVPAEPDRVIAYPRNAAATADPANFGPAGVVMAPVFKPVVDNVGRLDGGAFDDVAIAQLASDQVYLLSNDASGLSRATAIDFGAPTTSLIFPDLNADGLADAVATTLRQQSIQVRLGVASMTWGDPVHYNVGGVPRAIDTIFLPGDDPANPIPDLLCGNSMSITTLVGLADSNGAPLGAFRGARGYPIDVDMPSTVKLANLDNDPNGTLDAVVIGKTQETISFLEGRVDGGFEQRIVLPLNGSFTDEPAHLALSDIDDNGRLDGVVAITNMDRLHIYRNNGAIDQFEDPPPGDVLQVGSKPVGVAVADLDGDTSPDIFVCNSGDGTVQVLINDGAGDFTARAAQAVGVDPLGAVVMDFDSDDDMDAAILARSGSNYLVALLANDGAGNFTVGQLLPIDGPSNTIATGDFNGDGAEDFAVGQTLSSGDQVHVFLNDGGLAFTMSRVTVDRGPATVVVTDVDNDGNLDLLVLTTPGQLRAVLGDGEGNFGAAIPDGQGQLPVARETIGADFGDLTGDELSDLVFVSTVAPFLWVGINTSVEVPNL